jgi:hypothetical protein
MGTLRRKSEQDFSRDEEQILQVLLRGMSRSTQES